VVSPVPVAITLLLDLAPLLWELIISVHVHVSARLPLSNATAFAAGSVLAVAIAQRSDPNPHCGEMLVKCVACLVLAQKGGPSAESSDEADTTGNALTPLPTWKAVAGVLSLFSQRNPLVLTARSSMEFVTFHVKRVLAM